MRSGTRFFLPYSYLLIFNPSFFKFFTLRSSLYLVFPSDPSQFSFFNICARTAHGNIRFLPAFRRSAACILAIYSFWSKIRERICLQRLYCCHSSLLVLHASLFSSASLSDGSLHPIFLPSYPHFFSLNLCAFPSDPIQFSFFNICARTAHGNIRFLPAFRRSAACISAKYSLWYKMMQDAVYRRIYLHHD